MQVNVFVMLVTGAVLVTVNQHAAGIVEGIIGWVTRVCVSVTVSSLQTETVDFCWGLHSFSPGHGLSLGGEGFVDLKMFHPDKMEQLTMLPIKRQSAKRKELLTNFIPVKER